MFRNPSFAVERAGTIVCEADEYDLAKQRVEDAVRRIGFEMIEVNP